MLCTDRRKFSRVVALRIDCIRYMLFCPLCRLEQTINQLQLSGIGTVDGHTCQSKESTELIGQTRQVVCRT